LKLKTAALFSIIIFSALNAFSLEIKVRLFSNKSLKTVSLKASGGNFKIGKASPREIRLTAEDGEIRVRHDSVSKKLKKAEIRSQCAFSLKAGGRERIYYGKLLVENEGGRLKIVNEISLETYLLSVVAAESRDLANYQAYKAQAVVARTYTLANINRHKPRGYNLCDTTHCQLYNGFSDIKKEIKKAVKETEGEILVYRGKPAWTFYHSICGGVTEDVSNLWQYEKKPYLKSVTDGENGKAYCSGAYGFKWRTKIGLKTFEKFLRRKIISPKEIFKEAKIVSLSPSGRVMEMELVTDGKGKKISGVDFYHITGRDLGWNAIRSTKFRIYLEKKYIVFEGYGYGHGVGLCQHGADGMAKLGYDYRAILNHYYKNVKMIKLKQL